MYDVTQSLLLLEDNHFTDRGPFFLAMRQLILKNALYFSIVFVCIG